MAVSRLMTPYFGSGIEVWACIIATVMLSLMAGYYLGGMLADRYPRSDVLGIAVLCGGIFLALIPPIATNMLDWVLDNLGYEVNAILTAAVAIMVVPMTLLSFFSPYCVRLLLNDAKTGGRVAGSVYSITTIGNIVGTLGTALIVMRYVGSRQIMFTYAGVIALCGVALILLHSKARSDVQAS
jgi:MFS family permease